MSKKVDPSLSKTKSVEEIQKSIAAAKERRAAFSEKQEITKMKKLDMTTQTKELEELCQHVYVGRSKAEDTYYDVVAKVTVVGCVIKESNGKYALSISWSRRNPVDVYNKKLGYHIALRRALGRGGTLNEADKIYCSGFSTQYLKDIFFSIADQIIHKNEYFKYIN